MKVDPVVCKETLRLTVGLLVADALTCFVFFLLGYFDYTVVLGALLGTAAAVGNFFFLGITMQKATEKDSGQKRSVQLSYTLRMLVMGAVLVLAAILPCFHIIAAVVPLIMTTPVILLMQAITKKKNI